MNIQFSQRMRQGTVMTGQMQQAISLLQFTNTELQMHIDREAEDNPFIDFGNGPSLPYSGSGLGDAQDAIGRLVERPRSIYAHVAMQFDMLFSDPTDRHLADRFLEALNGHGWLGEPLEDIAWACGISLQEAQDILTRVQQVEPAGLFARDLAECLRLQVEDKGVMNPLLDKMLDRLPLLAAADMIALLKACGCTMAELRDALQVIRGLDPKPGTQFDIDGVTEREPDVIVRRGRSDWLVELNRSTLPAVHVDENRARVLRGDDAARDYAADRLRVAKWLRRAVEHRNQTTLLVSAEIVRHQSAFFDHGEAHLAPLTLADVADALEIHESTVSRVTTGILMVTPHGTLPVKRFFSTALAAHVEDGGAATSAAAVRFRIQQLVAAENPCDPLSDDAIAQAINDGGPTLARRTVAKYRSQLKIPSSFARKRRARIAAA